MRQLRRQNLSRILAASGLFALAGALLLIPLPNDDRAAWKSALLDLGHVPLFAVVTGVLYWVFRRKLPWAIAVALGLAALAELGQMAVDREPGLLDLMRGASGCLIVAVGVVAFGANRSRTLRWLGVLAIAGLIAWPIAWAAPAVADAWRARRDFPLLSSFAHPSEQYRWRGSGANFEPLVERGAGQTGCKILFPAAGEQFASAVLFPVIRDWSVYRRVCCDIHVEEGPFLLGVSVRDGLKIPDDQRRFLQTARLATGENTICVDLDSLARGGKYAPVDTTRIQSLHLIVPPSQEPVRHCTLRRVFLE